MKRQTAAAATILILLVTLATVSAQAQSSREVKLSVPFEFIIEDETFPSGEYIIRRTSFTRPSVMTIRSADGSTAKVFMTRRIGSRRPQAVRVTFHKYGTTYYLSQVWPAGSKNGRQLIKCQSEIKMETRAQESEEAPQLQQVILKGK